MLSFLIYYVIQLFNVYVKNNKLWNARHNSSGC